MEIMFNLWSEDMAKLMGCYKIRSHDNDQLRCPLNVYEVPAQTCLFLAGRAVVYALLYVMN